MLLATVAVPFPGAGSTTRIPAGFKATNGCSSVAQGVEYVTMRRGSPAANAYVGHIGPNSPVRLRVVSSNDRVPHHDESLEVPSTQCRRLSCLLGINGDYHDSNHESLGGVVKQGRLVRTPNPGRPHLMIWQDGRVGMAELPWTASVKTKEASPRTLALAGINTSLFPSNGLMLYTSDWGSRTRTSSTTEIVIKPGTALAPLGQTVTVDLSALATSDSAIPAGGAVLSGKGSAATFLKDLWNRGVRQVEVRADSAYNPYEALGGNPFLIGDGQNAFANEGSFTTSRQPRTFVGFNDAGDIFIVVVDGRQSASGGFSLAEAADFLRGLGATEGLNLDGGGGTVFVKDGKVASSPVDDGDQNAERGAPNILAVVVPPPTPGPALPPGPRSGYWMVSADGTVYRFGDARQHGYVRTAPNQAVDLEPTPSGNGYWLVDDAGRVFAQGDAPWFGNADPAKLTTGEKVTSLSATPSGNGYWIFTSKGRVLAFGNAVHRGDLAALRLNGPVLDSVATPSGNGYYMVGSDGGVFTFGDAGFYGSTGSLRLNAPVQSLVPDPDGVGYWLVASDGGVFTFEAPFRGAMGSTKLNKPMSGMVAFGNGYLMVAEDGGIFNFSDKPFHGSLGSCPAASPVISVAPLD
ncbi:MAG: phosphodiester glycosidase family protein [Acidimicrobiia bacterium]